MTGLAATAAAAWVYDSDALSARVLRGTVTDLTTDLAPPAKPNLSAWTDRTVDFCWIGHATVLVNFYGFKILTDPALFDRVGLQTPLGTLGRKRLVAAPLQPKDLSNVDVILLSHAHMDHLDFPSLKALPKSIPIVTAAKTEDLSRDLGYNKVDELRWGQKTTIRSSQKGSLEVEAFEVKHWGARLSQDTYRGYNGYVLSREGKSIIFGGDTALCDTFRPLANRKIAAAIMPIGSYGRGSKTHCTPEEAVTMLNHAKAEFVLPVHHSTFPIGKEPLAEPLERLQQGIEPHRIALQKVGSTWSLPI